MDTSRTGITGQTMNARTLRSCWFFVFFFLFPAIGLFLAGITGWHQLEGYLTSWGTKVNKSNIILKTLTLKKKKIGTSHIVWKIKNIYVKFIWCPMSITSQPNWK